MSINLLNSQHQSGRKCTVIGKEKFDSEKLYEVLWKKNLFHFFRFLCFSENAENAPNDNIKITKTENETKMIELKNYKSGC